MLADPALRYADIQACCSCLGFREDDQYKIDSDAEASIRGLLRYLRNENSDCDVRRELGRLRIVSSDLIPMLRSCKNNRILTELVVRLLMNLTQPAIVCFRQQIPKDRDLFGAFVQVDDLLKSYKKDFADDELFGVLRSLVGEFFDRKWEDRSEEDRLLVERILILVRNVLHINPDPTSERSTEEDVSTHDQLIWTMHSSGWDELLLFLGNSEDEQMFGFHTLEIISLLLREQTPENLALAGSKSGGSTEMSELSQRFWALESAEKRRFLRDIRSRQNRFGGTYELLGTQSLGKLPLIYHHDVVKTLNLPENIMASAVNKSPDQSADVQLGPVCLDVEKRIFRKPKNRKPLIERSVHRRSILPIQTVLQNFCWQFLRFCYNPLMRTIRSSLARQANQENDETYYLWAMRFFMAFCRQYKFHSAYLSETLSASTFHWIYDQIMHYREVLFSDKRGGGTNERALQASRRLELAVGSYREFLTCLSRMLKITETDRKPDVAAGETLEVTEERLRVQASAAESIMANVFYVSEYQEVYPMLLRDFNEAIQSREYLQNLVEGAYLFAFLLADRLKNGCQKLVVRRRKKIKHKRRRNDISSRRNHTDDSTEAESPELRTLRTEYQWINVLAPALINALNNPTEGSDNEEDDDPDESRLFDAASSGSEERQIQSAIRRVQAALFAGQALVALRLARRLWRLWPEVAPVTIADDDPVRNDDRAAVLSPSNLTILSALRQIHAAEFNAESDSESEQANASESDNIEDEELYNEEFGLSDDDGALVTVEKEVQMDLDSFMFTFVHPRIVHCFTLLLADYGTNPRSTNTALVHMIHRLAVRHKLLGSFFQLRLFYVFQQFLHDRAASTLAEFKDLANLIKYILRKFFMTLEKNNALSIELLFFKSVKEGHEVFRGYGTFEDNKKTVKWTPSLDEELTRLFEAYRNDPVPKGSDLGDVLLKHFSDDTKTRRQIVSRLITLGLIFSTKQLKQITVRDGEHTRSFKSSRRRRSASPEWTENEVIRLRHMVDAHIGSKTLLSDIMLDMETEHELMHHQLEATFDGMEHEEPPPLRSRRSVGCKILELGFVANKAALGRSVRKRDRDATGKRTQNVDLDASVSAHRKRKRLQHRDSSSEDELCFPSDEQTASSADDEHDEIERSSDEIVSHHSEHNESDKIVVSPTSDNNSVSDDQFNPKRARVILDDSSTSDSEERLRIDESFTRNLSEHSNSDITSCDDTSTVKHLRPLKSLDSSSDEGTLPIASAPRIFGYDGNGSIVPESSHSLLPTSIQPTSTERVSKRTKVFSDSDD